MAALPNATPVPVEEYLNTSYDPDVEYVDGVLVERKMGDWLHSLVQSNILFALRRKYPHLKVVAELRSKVAETRFRLPDVCALLAPPPTRYLADAAYLVVEVLSQDDRQSELMEKLKEYDSRGVTNIWVVDPRLRTVWVFRMGTLAEVGGDTVSTADGNVTLLYSEIFAE